VQVKGDVMSLGTRIMQIRSQKGLSQRELGERTGIAGSYLSRIENRRLEPRPKTLRKIAEALGVPVSELFQERPGGPTTLQCVITSSGHCVMDLLRAGRGKPPQAGTESYSPRQLQLLRMTNYLIQTADGRLLETLEVLLGALLNADRGQAGAPKLPVIRSAGEMVS
jgi:transcriptional regulator with XRE-family HTH domain